MVVNVALCQNLDWPRASALLYLPMPQPWLGTFVVSVGDQTREAHSLREPSATLPVDVRQHEAPGALHDGNCARSGSMLQRVPKTGA